MSLMKFEKRSSKLRDTEDFGLSLGDTKRFRAVAYCDETFLHMCVCSRSSSPSSDSSLVIDMPSYCRDLFC